VNSNQHKVLFDGTNFRDCAYGFIIDTDLNEAGVDALYDTMNDSDDEVFLPPLPALPVDDLTFEDPTHNTRFAEIFARTQMHRLNFDA
jgi:hypothetical protein